MICWCISLYNAWVVGCRDRGEGVVVIGGIEANFKLKFVVPIELDEFQVQLAILTSI